MFFSERKRVCPKLNESVKRIEKKTWNSTKIFACVGEAWLRRNELPGQISRGSPREWSVANLYHRRRPAKQTHLFSFGIQPNAHDDTSRRTGRPRKGSVDVIHFFSLSFVKYKESEIGRSFTFFLFFFWTTPGRPFIRSPPYGFLKRESYRLMMCHPLH